MTNLKHLGFKSMVDLSVVDEFDINNKNMHRSKLQYMRNQIYGLEP